MTIYSNKLSVSVEGAVFVHINVADASNGQPIANALVTMSPGNYSATTNSQGFVEFTNVPLGTYTVNVSANGYYPTSQTINVQGTMSTTIYLTEQNLIGSGQYYVVVKIKTETANGWMVTSDNGQVNPSSATITPTQSQMFTATSYVNTYKFVGFQISGNISTSQVITGSNTIVLTSYSLQNYATNGSTVTLYALYAPSEILPL